jgi:hypothetical protein
MAKSDLLKEAIADARAVKETAIANAKIALEEAFAPRIQRVLSAKLSEQLDDEEEVDDMDMELDTVETPEMDMDTEMDAEMDDMMEPGTVGVAVDLNNDGDYDLEGEIGAGAEEELEDMDVEMTDDEMEAEYDEAEMEEGRYNEADMNLDEIIAELEGEMYNDEEMEEQVKDSAGDDGDGMIEEDIDAIIESILAEEEMDSIVTTKSTSELDEAYKTIKELQYVINEVNLLNAKLLYTNKLFRNFELNDGQKMKVIENFDRASNTREVKLVFSTLAESFKRPSKTKRVVKESYASKPTTTTAPSTSKHVLTEGNELANRWMKLAGLTK